MTRRFLRLSRADRLLLIEAGSWLVCARLPQAVASTWMLRRRRTPSTLYLGLRHQLSPGIAGHAWVRAGQTIVTGGAESIQYQVIAAFALEPGSGARQERIATPVG